MSLLTEAYVRSQAQKWAGAVPAAIALTKALQVTHSRYDIFLSQTSRDAEIVLGVYKILTDLGYKVFCDWIDAPSAERIVNAETASAIRAVMSICDSLLFIDSPGAVQSLWMCWELGWFDGGKGPVAILPVTVNETKHYKGREFLGLYPYLEFDQSGVRVVRPVFVNSRGMALIESPNSISFDSWRNRHDDFMRPRVM